jgi:hypothetical protein
MKSFPEIFCVWITNQVLRFNCMSRQLSQIDCTGTVKNVCPNCGCRDKSQSHSTLLGSRTDVGIPLVCGKYCAVDGGPENRTQLGGSDQIISACLRHQISSLPSSPGILSTNGSTFLRLSWMEHLRRRANMCPGEEIHTQEGLQRGADFWACGLMRHLLKLTHHQWLYCKVVVHMKVKDSLTIAQHNTILTQMEECLQIDPVSLLVEDWELLNADFDKLTHGRPLDKLEWLAEMNTAWGATDHIAKGSCHALSSIAQALNHG